MLGVRQLRPKGLPFLANMAMVLEAFGMVIASQSGHRLPALTTEQNKALATTPVDELLALPMRQPDQVTDLLNA